MPEQSGDDFEVERIGPRCNHQCTKLLDLARFECAGLIVQCFQFSIMAPDFTHRVSQITVMNNGRVGVIIAADNCIIKREA